VVGFPSGKPANDFSITAHVSAGATTELESFVHFSEKRTSKDTHEIGHILCLLVQNTLRQLQTEYQCQLSAPLPVPISRINQLSRII
jgi:hypothetical protein